jgi:hypothetical protein
LQLVLSKETFSKAVHDCAATIKSTNSNIARLNRTQQHSAYADYLKVSCRSSISRPDIAATHFSPTTHPHHLNCAGWQRPSGKSDVETRRSGRDAAAGAAQAACSPTPALTAISQTLFRFDCR